MSTSEIAAQRDKARTERDRARDTLSKIRGIVVALSKGIGHPQTALDSIAGILHVGQSHRRRVVRPSRRGPG